MRRIWVMLGVVLLTACWVRAADDHADTAAGATLVPAGTNGVAGLFEHDLDRDWFRFMAAPQLVYTIQVNNITVFDNGLSVKAFAEGDALVSTNSAFAPNPSRIVWTNQGGARSYYLGVAPLFDFTTGTYVVVVGANDTDADGDGMADAWETLMFGTTTNGAGGDPDLDGLTTVEEYRSGTHPGLAGSGLRVTNVVRAGGATAIDWPGVAFGGYRVEATTNLRAGVWALVTNRTQGASAGPMQALDPGPAGGFRNYRVIFHEP